MNRCVAIISDIHGNYPALKAVLDDIDSKGINEIYCLGDLVGYYCMFNEVIEEIRKRNIPCIMGNHDYALAFNNGVIERSKTCTKILMWQRGIIAHDNLDYLKSLKSSIIFSKHAIIFFCTHGGLEDNIDEYLFEVPINYFSEHNFNYDALITGHTHLPSYKSFFSGKFWINPGSVGQPRDGNIRSAYVIIDHNLKVHFERINYNTQLIVEAMKKNQFEEYIYQPLLTGKKIAY